MWFLSLALLCSNYLNKAVKVRFEVHSLFLSFIPLEGTELNLSLSNESVGYLITGCKNKEPKDALSMCSYSVLYIFAAMCYTLMLLMLQIMCASNSVSFEPLCHLMQYW